MHLEKGAWSSSSAAALYTAYCFTYCKQLHVTNVHGLSRSIDFMPPRNTSRVEVAEDVDVFPDGRNQVSFHNLHVVDVIEQLHALRVHFANDSSAQAVWSHM